MRIKERLLANALSAVLCDKNAEVVVRDETGTFLFYFDEDTQTLHMDALDGEEPLRRVALGGTLIVESSPPRDAKLN